MRILTGLQPSGKLHLGNYFSAIRKMLEYQNREELYLFVANLHSLTSFRSRNEQMENTKNAILDLLALGIDPDRTVFWVQSDVPEVTEITWYLSMAITTSQLSLAHSYKDKISRGINPSAGLYNYPILMAADILSYQAERVPVGRDQKQHLEFTRDIAIKFNSEFGETFVVPEPDIDENTAVVPGIDGAKMSKSYRNAIHFFDDEKSLKKSIMSIVSDSAGIDEPKDPDTSTIFAIYSLFLNEKEKTKLRQRFLSPGLGYGDLKKELLETVLAYFKPYREKREFLQKEEKYIQEILAKGAKKARDTIQPTLEKCRSLLGVAKFF